LWYIYLSFFSFSQQFSAALFGISNIEETALF